MAVAVNCQDQLTVTSARLEGELTELGNHHFSTILGSIFSDMSSYSLEIQQRLLDNTNSLQVM